MKQQEVKSSQSPVPLYTKIGWLVAWVVMLGLAAMILRNCATSVFYGLQTDQAAVDASYQQGVRDGSSGQGYQKQLGEGEANSVLRKAYVKGYRDGLDKGRGQGKPPE